MLTSAEALEVVKMFLRPTCLRMRRRRRKRRARNRFSTHNNMSGDIFADLLKGADSSGAGASSTNVNDSNLSLNQRMNAATGTQRRQNGGLDLDFLDTYVSKKPVNSSTSSDIDDLLFSAPVRAPSGASSSLNVSGNVQNSNSNSNSNDSSANGNTSTDLLDDFFGQPVPTPSATVPRSSATRTAALSSTQASTPTPPTAETSGKSVTPTQELRDGALAELMDMGFPLAKANAALDSTASGYDLDGAISFLMEQAHSQTSSRQQQQQQPQRSRWESPLQEPPQSGEDFGSIVNDLSSEFMSTASFLFNTGKKKIQEGVDMYRRQRLDNNDGQPLWMKNQSRYKANSMKVPGFTDEDEQEMDPETMRQLIQQQRLREQRLRQEKQRQDDLLSAQTSPSPSTSMSSRSPSSLSRDDRRSNASKPSRHEDDSVFEIYTSSSRHRSSKANTRDATPTTKRAAEVPFLIETSTTPTKASATDISSAPKLTIPPLDSAQTMSFTASREIGQEKFKTGDYTASLENFLAASSVIPADHPYQIILNSNLAVVYSKLGNPKEQLAVSTRGLDLLSKNTGNAPVSDLSTIDIEANKNLKTFWVKLMTKRAESLEFLEKWTDAKEAYETLIKEGESTKAVMDGKNRCVKILNPKPQTSSRPGTRTQSRPSTVPKQSRQVSPPKDSEILKHVQETNMKREKEEEEKFNLHDKVELQLDTWRAGNKSNIRALICSLDKILWPELNWQPVKLTDLVLDKKVKIYYMKAVAKTHPDKLSSSESVENKMIANGVFITLNEAWETFKQGKGM